MKNVFKIFGRYFWDHKFVFALLTAMLVTFAATMSLYGFPLTAIGYAALLSGAVGLLGIVISFVMYYRKNRILTQLQDSITLRIDNLPDVKNLAEQDYQELLKLLYEEKKRISLASDRAISDMVDYYTLWAHQIKTPIAAMRLLIESRGGDEALSAELFKIEQYVEMVLTYMRLESDYTDYVLKKYPLDDIVRQAVRKYSKLFILKDVALNYDGVDLNVMSDAKWLLFVIEQILSNAIKYTNEGSVSIYAKEGKLVIQDTGIGIRESDLPRIFEKGFTGFNGRENIQSTGLGLYLSKRILNRLSHSIVIESDANGTKVVIGFPKEDIILE